MSKFEFGEYENGDPFVKITGQHEDIIGDYENSMLFTHGVNQEVDHYFISIDRAREIGAFIFRHTMHDFDEFANALIERDFGHMHKRYPHPVDIEQWEKTQPKVTVEAEDDQVVEEAMSHFEEELNELLGGQ
jgi:hypothetical protein